jgi:hypothetical protein
MLTSLPGYFNKNERRNGIDLKTTPKTIQKIWRVRPARTGCAFASSRLSSRMEIAPLNLCVKRTIEIVSQTPPAAFV